MRLSDTLKKAAGLFVEIDEPATPAVDPNKVPSMTDDELRKYLASPSPAQPTGNARTVEQVVKDMPGINLDEIKVPQETQLPTLMADGSVNYKAIYQMANVADSAFTAEQLLELLATLPPELPMEARRQTVKITIQAMAKTVPVTPEIIVADASRKLAALAAYDSSFGKQADEFVAKTETDILALEAQIEAKKKAIEDAKAKHETMNKACTAEGDRLDDVLEFFSLDVPPSKYAK